MNMIETVTTFPAAMMDFFGKLPEETTKSFMEELKALTAEDRAEFTRLLKEKGYKIQ